MSKLETNTIDTVSGSNTLTLGSTNTSTISVGSPISNGLTLSDNILFDTASKGIYLGVTSATASNLLDDYEEGTWTPTENNGVTLTQNDQARYTKIGDTVFLWFNVTVATNTNANSFDLSSVPFEPRHRGSAGGVVYFCDLNNSQANSGLSFMFHATSLRLLLRTGYDATVSLSNMSGKQISGCAIYKVA